MNKLSEMVKGIKEKWNGISKSKKIALTIIILAAIVTIGIFSYISLSNKYAVLFSNMEAKDSGEIIANLESKKINYKVDGSAILVEKSQVDKLRMELLSEVPLTEGSNGFELFDNGKIAPTDEESKVMYQRALAGELERTIKAFEEVEWSKVNLVLPSSSPFVTKPSPASASVTLKLAQGKDLSIDQVKAIVSLISGSVENLPKENVTVVSDNFKLLTEGIFDEENGQTNSATTDKQLEATKKIEKEYENKIMNVLEPIYKDKIRVSVSAQLNFDAIKQNNVLYNKDGSVVVSEHQVITQETGSGNTSGSPVDNNMGETQGNTDNNQGVTHSETTKNYENSKTEETVVKSPGQVERITASIVVNDAIDGKVKTSIENLASKAIGYNEERGDAISVESLQFNDDYKEQAQKELEAMKEAEAKAKRNKLIAMSVATLAGIIFIILIIVMIRKKSKEEEDVIEPTTIDVVVGEEENTLEETSKLNFKSLELERETEKEHTMKEIKKYAERKPEQVADIIKSWLAEDERG